jgi:hypothetical protein
MFYAVYGHRIKSWSSTKYKQENNAMVLNNN